MYVCNHNHLGRKLSNDTLYPTYMLFDNCQDHLRLMKCRTKQMDNKSKLNLKKKHELGIGLSLKLKSIVESRYLHLIGFIIILFI